MKKCKHDREIMGYCSYTFREAEQESQESGEPNTHPLPPFCLCCGDVCPLGWVYCEPCGWKRP